MFKKIFFLALFLIFLLSFTNSFARDVIVIKVHHNHKKNILPINHWELKALERRNANKYKRIYRNSKVPRVTTIRVERGSILDLILRSN